MRWRQQCGFWRVSKRSADILSASLFHKVHLFTQSETIPTRIHPQLLFIEAEGMDYGASP